MATNKIFTYNSKDVLVSLGGHSVTGYADDSFISIEKDGDGVMVKTGCDGEIARSIDPNKGYVVKIALLQSSPTTKWLQDKFAQDQESGEGMFPITIKDLKGKVVFNAPQAWVTKPAARTYGKDTNNREWELHTGPATYTE